MANQTEMKMIEVIDNYIKYMLTEQNGGKDIYQHLLEQTEENLGDWVNNKLKEWLGNENCYDFQILVCKECGYEEEDCECEKKETEEEECDYTSNNITRFIGYMIDREVEKQMEDFEIPQVLLVANFEFEKFENCGVLNCGGITHNGWIHMSRVILQEKEKEKFYDNIFSNCREMLEVIEKLKDFYNEYEIKVKNDYEEFMTKYCYMYIYEMEATDLKEYIINLIDPVEPK